MVVLPRLRAVLMLASVVLAGVGVGVPGAAQIPTPRLSSWQQVSSDAGDAWIMVGEAPVPGASWRFGAVVLCAPRGPRVGAYFGPFPRDGRPVQFAVRLPDQSVVRAGPVVSGGPDTGFHDPFTDEPVEALRIGRAILTPGALISNGYFSFWNAAGPALNARVLADLERCAG